jgi:hypothetical protein
MITVAILPTIMPAFAPVERELVVEGELVYATNAVEDITVGTVVGLPALSVVTIDDVNDVTDVNVPVEVKNVLSVELAPPVVAVAPV